MEKENNKNVYLNKYSSEKLLKLKTNVVQTYYYVKMGNLASCKSDIMYVS